MTSEDSPITDPTERSMPPVMITMTMPMDMIAISEKDLNTPIRLSVVRKYGVEKLMSATTTRSAVSTFSSRTWSSVDTTLLLAVERDGRTAVAGLSRTIMIPPRATPFSGSRRSVSSVRFGAAG